jgi:hypothetical protein
MSGLSIQRFESEEGRGRDRARERKKALSVLGSEFCGIRDYPFKSVSSLFQQKGEGMMERKKMFSAFGFEFFRIRDYPFKSVSSVFQ